MCLHVHSLGICARVLFVLTHEGVLGEWSIGDDKGELTRENDLLEVLVTLRGASLLGKKNLLRSVVVIPTYGEIFEDMWSTGEYFIFLHGSLGNLYWLYPRGVSSTLWGLSFSQLTTRLSLYLRPKGESLHGIVLYWGFFWKIELTREFFWWLMVRWGILLMLSICCGCLCGHCVFYPTEGSLVVLTYSWIFLLHFLPSENPLGILRNFFLAKLYVV